MSTPPFPQTLDPALYNLDQDELTFYKSATGIADEEQLKKHILEVQAKAYGIFPYPCIRTFGFTKLKIARLPAYKDVLKLGKEREGAILLDIGCCFGNDARKAISDGFPANQVICADLRKEFLDLGHELFQTTPESIPITFIPGDAFDEKYLASGPIFYDPPTEPKPAVASLTSLTPLKGHVSIINASSFFHLFGEKEQFELAKRTASLLSPEPGSLMLGVHVGRKDSPGMRINGRGKEMYAHCPESWKEMWDGQIFRKGTVEVQAGLKARNIAGWGGDEPEEVQLMWWSVKRL